MCAEIERWQATLAAVGSHGHRRLSGIVLGSTATELIHRAPCSVLVARAGSQTAPRAIVVGLDGSPEEPVKALVAAAGDADLLVIGSCGLHGLKALGSVSERVAHQAPVTTLVVR